jgi:hypothetical protein
LKRSPLPALAWWSALIGCSAGTTSTSDCSAGIPQNYVSFGRETYKFAFPGAPADLMNEFRYYHGETMEAFEAAEKMDVPKT